jgi:hypothetical protein
VSTAIRLPRSYEPGPEIGTWFSIDPQPASISPTISISIVFICAFLVDCGRIIRRQAIKNDSSAMPRSGQRFVVRAGENYRLESGDSGLTREGGGHIAFAHK